MKRTIFGETSKETIRSIETTMKTMLTFVILILKSNIIEMFENIWRNSNVKHLDFHYV